MPRNLEPMLATAAKALPGGDGWGFEVKWDGVRALAFVTADELRISARRGEDVASRYPELAPIAAAYAGRELILDGEVVAFDPEGNPSFGRLQRRMGLTNLARIRRRTAETPVTYVAFDLLWLDGRSLLAEPYERRRELLAELGFDGPAWQTPRHRLGDGEALLAAARERGLEGIVAKRLASPYRPGRRSADWIKVQNRRRQELVVGGFMPGEGGRSRRLGSLLVGYWDATPEEAASLGRPQRLVYAGGVGTGFSQATLAELTALLEPLRRATSPFEAGWDPQVKYAARIRERGPIQWVEPVTVCEIEFLRWTHEDTIRAASFKGVRDDKDPREVVREQ
ncbi:MAG: ligD [Solirubrobacterales bacterium]|jgi:bifunctional non-homologous end joining protein LigD|nr:ligD [Solirubrobacterales bacterium]